MVWHFEKPTAIKIIIRLNFAFCFFVRNSLIEKLKTEGHFFQFAIQAFSFYLSVYNNKYYHNNQSSNHDSYQK
jgi:hypothetical protein